MRPERGAVPKAATAVNGGETTVYEEACVCAISFGVLSFIINRFVLFPVKFPAVRLLHLLQLTVLLRESC